MVRRDLRRIAVALCLTVVASSNDASPQDLTGDVKAIEGLWSGSWGGGGSDGIVFQPVIAELVIKGDQVELAGFRNVSDLTGTVRLDVGTRRLRITPGVTAGGQAEPKAIEYAYAIKGDTLTLTDGDMVSISLQKHRVEQDPLANARVDLVTADGIDDAGDLLVTEFTVLRAGRADATFFRPEKRPLSTKEATVFLVQEARLKEASVAEARRLLRGPAPVVVMYRQDDRQSPPQFHKLWKDVGSPMPDSEAVRRTLARVLRPGTLVFVLPASESVPRP